MEGILLGLILFFDIIQIIVIIDIIFSWLHIFGIPFRPKILEALLNPLYGFIRNLLPSTIGPFDFCPLIIILGCIFAKWSLFSLFPNLSSFVNI